MQCTRPQRYLTIVCQYYNVMCVTVYVRAPACATAPAYLDHLTRLQLSNQRPAHLARARDLRAIGAHPVSLHAVRVSYSGSFSPLSSSEPAPGGGPAGGLLKLITKQAFFACFGSGGNCSESVHACRARGTASCHQTRQQ